MRCRARPPRSRPGPVTPTADISSSSTSPAPTALRRSARILEFAADARSSIWRPRATATDAGLDVDGRGSGPLTGADTTELARVADRRNLVRLTRHGDIVAQRARPMLTIGRAQLALPPGAFLQATLAGETILAQLVEA